MYSVSLFRMIPLLDTIRNYKKENIKKDIIGALTVMIVGIPQYMAYALIAGVNPIYGLYTGILPTIMGSAFGCSNQLITGPTNAICLLTASAMIRFMKLPNAMEMLFLMTFMVGVLQVLYGVFKFGKLIDFVSHTVLVGFMAGAGLNIAAGQLKTFLGISIKNSSAMSPLQIVIYLISHITQTNPYVLGVGLMTIVIIVICKKISKNLPGALIGIIVPIFVILMYDLQRKGVQLTGNIPTGLPPFKMFQLDPTSIKDMLSGAFSISIIGLVEAISISKAIGSNTRQKINSNQEFIGQGLANIVGSFFQCIPSSGSFSRSAINFVNGGVSRFAGVFAGVLMAIVLLLFAPFAKYIPSAGLAGVLVYTGYGLIDKQEIKKVVKTGILSSDSLSMWVTCILVLVLPNLDYAIYTGVALSIILYLKDTHKAPVKLFVSSEDKGNEISLVEIDDVKENLDTIIIQLEGNLYFGGASDLSERLNILIDKSKVFIFRMKFITTMDLTSIGALKGFIRNVKEAGGMIIISGVNPKLSTLLEKTGVTADVGEENVFLMEKEVFAATTNAFERAKALLKQEQSRPAPKLTPSAATPSIPG